MDNKEDSLEKRVSAAVDTVNVAFFSIIICALVLMFFTGQIFLGIIMVVVAFALRPLMFALLEKYLSATIPMDLIAAETAADAVAAINERLANGSLSQDSEELDALMLKAGLSPPARLVEAGPTLGTQFGHPIYEWVISKLGAAGEPRKFTWIQHADVDENNIVNFVPEPGKEYVIVEEMLYERTLEEAEKLPK